MFISGRTKMRKGIFLVEMMGIMLVMSLLAIMMIKPMRNVTRNIPHMHRDYQINSIINDMLGEMRKDVEMGKKLMRYRGSTRGSADMLLIDSPQGVISYSFQEGRIVKYRDHREGIDVSDAQVVWSVPNGKIDWRLRTHGGKDVAVEISTGVNRRSRSGMKTNLKNSHVLFVGVNTFSEQL